MAEFPIVDLSRPSDEQMRAEVEAGLRDCRWTPSAECPVCHPEHSVNQVPDRFLRSLNDWATQIWQSNEDNGWHQPFVDEDGFERYTSTTERLALIGTEVAEGIEAVRKGWWWNQTDEKGKIHGLPSELADIIIRTLELCAIKGIDIDAEVEAKLGYNTTRPDVPARAGGKSI
jgi:hypothetical protein